MCSANCRILKTAMQSHIFVTSLILLTCQLSVESTGSDESNTDSCFCQVHANDVAVLFYVFSEHVMLLVSSRPDGGRLSES